MADELDDLLDQALESYSAGEPLEGLEGRVLARVSGHKRRAIHWNWMAAAACLLILVGTVGWRTFFLTAPSRSQLSRFTVGHVAVNGKRSRGLGAPVPKLLASASVHRPSRDPERSVARHPRILLTREEVLLTKFVTADPEQAAKHFASLNDYVQQDMTIQPLVVEPIKIEEIER